MDRIVVPESYRNEILRVGHAIPLSGHMGNAKTLDRIAAHFFGQVYRPMCESIALHALSVS